MFKNIIGAYKSFHKFCSDTKEWNIKQQERENLAKDARRMIEDLTKILYHPELYPEPLIWSDKHYSGYHKGYLPDDNYEREEYVNFQVDKLKEAFPVFPGNSSTSGGYNSIDHSIDYLKHDLNKLICKGNSDDEFVNELENFSKKIEEKKHEITRLMAEYNKRRKEYFELKTELKFIFYNLYKYRNYNINRLVREVKNVDILNLQWRLIEIKEKIGVLPQNSIEKDKVESAIIHNDSIEKQPQDFINDLEDFPVNIPDYIGRYKEDDYQDYPLSKDNSNTYHKRDAIKKFSQQQKISKLIHFTKHKNLHSIIKNGILHRTRLSSTSIEHQINDFNRWDNCLDAISLSISHPNQLMFYKYRKMNIDENWVVLIIDPTVLWEKDCAFCRHNAADSRMSKIPIEGRKSFSSFQSMFSDVSNSPSRLEQNLPKIYPTDVQAEVLVFDKIDVGYIKEVAFDNTFLEKEFNQNFPFIKTVYNPTDKHYFGFRN